MMLAAQCHLGSKNLQVHMEPYVWKTRPDGINVINIGKTWYAMACSVRAINAMSFINFLQGEARPGCPYHCGGGQPG